MAGSAFPVHSAEPVERLRDRLGNVRPCGAGFTARCPAHDDQHNSLKVDPGDDGRALVKCFAGCDTEAVVAALGLGLADLFADAGTAPRLAVDDQRPSPPANDQGSGGSDRAGPILAEYLYRDAAGPVHFRVTRHDPKTFRPWHRDPSGRWTLGMGDVAPIPYRLPELAAADPRRSVFVVEGEKDVDRLAALGAVATCNPGGAGKWRPEFGAHLAGRRVVILPDNDAAGRRHAEQVAAALHGVAAGVRVVALPGLPEKGDVSDWLDAGGTPAELKRLIADAPAWRPPAAPAGPSLVVTSLAAVRPVPVDWLWPRWLARGKLHILGGHAGDGKSTLTAALAAVCSTAGTLPDGAPAPRARWLFLLAEDALDDTLRPRLDAHGADPSQVFAIEAVREPDGRDRLFNLADHLPLLEAAIREHGIDVAVIDPVTSFMPRTDRNAEGDVRDALTPLGKLAERTGVAVVGIMHVGKPNGTGRRPLQQLLGATAFGAIARTVWMVAPCPGDTTGARRVLGVVKSNLAMKPEALEWSRAEDGPIAWHGVSKHDLGDLLGGAPARPRDDAEGFLSELLRGGSRGAADVLALAKAAGIAEKTLRRAADDLGIVRFKQPNARNGPWLWRLPDGTPASAAVDEDAPPKVATPEDAPVAIFGSTHWSGKVATAGETGHLPPSEGATEGGHLAGFGGGHLLAGALRSPDGLVPPDLAETARRIAALTPAERTTYRTELAQAPPDDPNLAHDRAAFGIAEAALAGRPVPGWAP